MWLTKEDAVAGRYKSKLHWSDVTPKEAFLNRRQIIAGASAAGFAGIAAPGMALDAMETEFGEGLTPNEFEDVSTYCNFYEFGTGKGDPAENAGAMQVEPWTVKIDGLVEKPGDYMVDDILSGVSLEERIYRFRCVEAWSMVVPWIGFELADLLDRVGVQPSAKYVAFETALLPDVMIGVRFPVLDWPYREGLRLDEAMHPLTLMTVGMYDQELPNQNGAPLRLIVPWKYGFKSIKSIVRISLVEEEPPTSWNMANAREYGFYSNVNPNVDHPRWSQATERRIGGGLFARRQETLMFNGYEEEVASLYSGMDLAKNY